MGPVRTIVLETAQIPAGGIGYCEEDARAAVFGGAGVHGGAAVVAELAFVRGGNGRIYFI